MKLFDSIQISQFLQLKQDYPEELIINIKLSDDQIGNESDDDLVERIEKLLITTIGDDENHLYTGHEFGGGFARIFFSSKNVDQLYRFFHFEIKRCNAPKNSKIILDYAHKKEPFIIDPNALPN